MTGRNSKRRDNVELSDEEAKEILGNLPIRFGLRAQGHLPKIEQMLKEGKSWEEIGAAILWDPATAERHYRRYQEGEAQRKPVE